MILTTFDLDEYVFASLEAGASGFLVKNAPAADLVRAIRVVDAGEALLSPGATRTLIDAFAGKTRLQRGGLDELLTRRELDVLGRLAAGDSNEELAQSLYISEETVKTHVSNVLAKRDVRDRVQAVIRAYESGFVDPETPKS